MKRLFPFLTITLLLVCGFVKAQITVNSVDPYSGGAEVNTYKMRYSSGVYLLDKSAVVHSVSGGQVVLKSNAKGSSLRLINSSLPAASIVASLDSSQLTITLSNGPAVENFVLQEVIKEESIVKFSMVKLALTAKVSSLASGVTAGGQMTDAMSFTLGGGVQEIKTLDGTSTITYNGGNRFTGEITDGCLARFSIDRASESDVTYAYESGLHNTSVRLIDFSNGDWMVFKYKNTNPLAITYDRYNVSQSHFWPGDSIFLRWRASDCLDSIYVNSVDFNTVFADSVEPFQVEEDTLLNIPDTIYNVYGTHLIDGEVFLYSFEVSETPPGPEPLDCPELEIAQNCSSSEEEVAEFELSIQNNGTIDNPWNVSGGGSGEFDVDIDMELSPGGDMFIVSPKFKGFKGLGGDWAFEVLVTNDSGSACVASGSFSETDMTINGSVDIFKECDGNMFVGSQYVNITPGTSCIEEEFEVEVDGQVTTTDATGIVGAIESSLWNTWSPPGDPFYIPVIDIRGTGGVTPNININVIPNSYPPYIPYIGTVMISEGESYTFSEMVDGYDIQVNWPGGGEYRYDGYELMNNPIFMDNFEVGSNMVSISAWDCFYMQQDYGNFEVFVNNLDPQIISAISDAPSYDEGTSITISVDAFDFTPLSVVAELNGSSVVLSHSGGTSYTGVLIASGSGASSINVTASDEYGGTVSTSINVDVNQGTNKLPVISNISPSSGSTVNVGDQINVGFDALDEDGIIISASISFGGVVIPLSTSPYNASFDALIAGVYDVTLTVEDDAGGITVESISIEVIAPNIAPTVSIISPINFDQVEQGVFFTVDVNAQDQDGQIVQVDISYNGLTETLFNQPYSFSFEAVGLGTQVIDVSVRDNEGAQGVESVQVDIVPAINILPTVSILSPSASLEVDEGQLFTVSIDAQDQDGFIQSVTVDYDGVNYLLNAPYSIDLTASQTGNRDVIVTVTDDKGGEVIETVGVVVLGQDMPSEVVINAPTVLSGIGVGDIVNIDFDVIQGTDPLASVTLLVNGSPIVLTNAGGNYSTQIDIASFQAYSIELLIEDSNGDIIRENINIDIENTPPTLSITSPVNGTTVEQGDLLVVEFSAIDIDDNVQEIIVEVGGIPYTLTPGASSYELPMNQLGDTEVKITVVDTEGGVISETVSVEVIEPNPGPEVVINSPSILDGYHIGDIIMIDFDVIDRDGISSINAFIDSMPVVLVENGGNYSLDYAITNVGDQALEIVVENINQQITTQSLVFTSDYRDPSIDILSPSPDVLYTTGTDIFFDFEISDPDGLGIDSVELLLFDINNPEGEVYKLTLTEAPYGIPFSELAYFPWTNDVIGLQVTVNSGGKSASDYQELNLKIAIGLDDVSYFTVEMYPLPANDFIIIEGIEEANWIISDLKGRTLMNGVISGKTHVDTNELTQGMYLMEILTEAGRVVKRIEKL